MPLIDSTFFITEINIPNRDRAGVLEPLNNMIKKREPEVLTGLMGYSLYTAFIAGLAVMPTPEQRMVELKEGKDYVVNGVTYRWKGLVIIDGLRKEALSANYVYYWFLRYGATLTTGVGEATTNTENAGRVAPARKQSRAWNEMVEWAKELTAFLQHNTDVYPEYKTACIDWQLFVTINPYNL